MQYSAKKVLLFSWRQITLDTSEVVSYMLWVSTHSVKAQTQMKIYILLTIRHFQRKPAVKDFIGFSRGIAI